MERVTAVVLMGGGAGVLSKTPSADQQAVVQTARSALLLLRWRSH